ncbi:hypothetical protein P154DRAFT_572953 [Amniculicola lignicola CBS 123094]|uniref:Ubiquitin 3 binding protein But2 C-terminal domain-containing protein n=1 Tax=Amniculicola lignicola CBS 123094 TaxID=1392246 RepID=A0A6A5WS47_9PLEO|nr:hypothetical protein P154DRAFT_572953 [Amniculicola lignicola CBS 123094]
MRFTLVIAAIITATALAAPHLSTRQGLDGLIAFTIRDDRNDKEAKFSIAADGNAFEVMPLLVGSFLVESGQATQIALDPFQVNAHCIVENDKFPFVIDFINPIVVLDREPCKAGESLESFKLRCFKFFPRIAIAGCDENGEPKAIGTR